MSRATAARCSRGHYSDPANGHPSRRDTECPRCTEEARADRLVRNQERARKARAVGSAQARIRREVQLPRRIPVVAPYDQAVAELEPVFGPIARWTREQHAACTDRMCELAGLDPHRARKGEAARRGPTVGEAA